MNSRFISLEGIEGVGKSTNMDFIESWLRERGQNVVVTREPGGTPVAEKIRSLILESDKNQLPEIGELLLMFAARSAHVDTLIRPVLARGDWVICDRFIDASYAYQACGRGFGDDVIGLLEDWVLHGLNPGLTVLLDISLAGSQERTAERDFKDRFEREQTEFFARVRAGYLARMEADPDRIKLVDAGQTLKSVQQQIARILTKYIDKLD
ncbi:MAG: dTMP kinase [Thiogranum sp.]